MGGQGQNPPRVSYSNQSMNNGGSYLNFPKGALNFQLRVQTNVKV